MQLKDDIKSSGNLVRRLQNGKFGELRYSPNHNGAGVRRRRLPWFRCYIGLIAAACAASSFVSAFSLSHPSSTSFTSSIVDYRRPVSRSLSNIYLTSRSSILRQEGHVRCRIGNSWSALFAKKGPGRKKREPDEDEWRALIAAFQMYKAAYGDLKVPSRFIVPAMPPWPENAWKLKLGQRVAQIRSTGKYVQNNETRRKMLDDMGFIWRVRAASPDKNMEGITFDQIYDALVTYRQVEQPPPGTLSVPPNFVVPDCDPWPESTRGLPLGKKLPTVRTKSYLKANPGATEKLQGLGFEFDGKVAANDARFNKVYEALKTYKDIYGDLLVPQPFVVPEESEDWPEETWGLRLGARVNAIRSQGTFVNTNPARRKMLDDLGFAWSPPTADGGKRRGRRKREDIEALMGPAMPGIFSGTSATPGSGKVDDASAESPPTDSTAATMESLFGPAFGYKKDPFLSGKDAAKTAPTWGFENDGGVEASTAAEEAKRAAEEDYKPPKSLSESLKEAADKAIACGVVEYMTEDNRIKKGKREKDIPWFNDDFGDGFVFEDVVEALTLYKTMYTNFSGLIENDEFVVPSPAGTLEEIVEVSGSFDNTASARAAAAIAAFEEEGKTMESEDLISAEIKRMQEATSPMPVETEVAEEETFPAQQWPEHLSGMSLGNIVRRIRDGSLEVKHLPERKAQLDAIDFDWGDPKRFLDVPFEKAMCSMYAYYLIRGDMFVYEDFVMPDEDPWPKALAGYELGKAVKRIRELQNFMEAYHTDKVGLLRAIDFMWFPNLALHIDPDEGEMTDEMLLVIANGHPDYAKMVDIPLGLPEKIMADGPFFESDDPKMWWRKWHNWDYVKDYWYELGRRDNAFVLRKAGYNMLADEHEAKYGPGLFQQINETMQELEDGIEDKSEEECAELLKKLKYYREEMTGCRDIPPKDRKQLLEDLDYAMLSLMDEENQESLEEEEVEYEYEEEVPEEAEALVEEADSEYEEEEEEEEEVEEEVEEEEDTIEEEEFDIEDELGLDEGVQAEVEQE